MYGSPLVNIMGTLILESPDLPSNESEGLCISGLFSFVFSIVLVGPIDIVRFQGPTSDINKVTYFRCSISSLLIVDNL